MMKDWKLRGNIAKNKAAAKNELLETVDHGRSGAQDFKQRDDSKGIRLSRLGADLQRLSQITNLLP